MALSLFVLHLHLVLVCARNLVWESDLKRLGTSGLERSDVPSFICPVFH